MAIRAFVLAAAALSMTGCYFETLGDRAPIAGKSDEGDAALTDDGTCRVSVTKGCFEGNIFSMQNFFVDGKEFFNADNLGSRFGELLTITDDKGMALTAGEDYELKLDKPLDNNSFLAEFSYDLTGKAARRDKVRKDGNFAINDLPEGNYDLRIQRPVKFYVITKTAGEPDPTNPDRQPDVEVKTKTRCATIYADSVLEVRHGQRSVESFSDFKLHVTDDDCASASGSPSISAP